MSVERLAARPRKARPLKIAAVSLVIEFLHFVPLPADAEGRRRHELETNLAGRFHVDWLPGVVEPCR